MFLVFQEDKKSNPEFTPTQGIFQKKKTLMQGSFRAGDQGFEPQISRPERDVMPFHQSPIFQRAVFYHAQVHGASEIRHSLFTVPGCTAGTFLHLH